jgi:hypothetical protein
MILDIFLSDNWTLKRPTITTANWEQTKWFTTITNNLKCRLYNVKSELVNNNLSQETEITTAKIITNYDGVNNHDVIVIDGINFLVEKVITKKVKEKNHFEIYLKQI